MAIKRMRVFAGPNGSGKTTIFKGILAERRVNLGIYVNADEIEAALLHENALNFADFSITVTQEQVQLFFKESSFSPLKRKEPDLWNKLNVEENRFSTIAKVDSYLAADLAEFIRRQLLINGLSFTYETVMSHPGKVDFLNEAMQNGFRVYLYFIATEDPEINISRVNVRVAQEGHSVSPEIVRGRYYKSLQNLKKAVMHSSRAYIFDNSQKRANLIAEITDGMNVSLNGAIQLPNWVAEYLLTKKRQIGS
ncbi:MAG: zeta toxin family protein [Sediminibacterium sp.]|nr:zeta toxin family protein [Sediminibacterium sp.]